MCIMTASTTRSMTATAEAVFWQAIEAFVVRARITLLVLRPEIALARIKTGASPALNRRAAAAFFAGSLFCFRDLYMWADRQCANVGRAGGFR
jgi:hypothetical protein